MSYDSAITVFSPSGNLYQVEYAMEAVKKGLCLVAVKGKDCIIVGVEKKSVTVLQEPRTVKKIVQLDKHTIMSFSGLNADARIITNMARVECQSYSINYDDMAPVDYVVKYIAQTKQKFTQKGGARPFGISTLVAGFDTSNLPRIFQTDPSGSCTEWNANSVGRNSRQIIEFLEKNYKTEQSIEECLKVACKALLDIVESGSKNIELTVLTRNELRNLNEEEIEKLISNVNQ